MAGRIRKFLIGAMFAGGLVACASSPGTPLDQDYPNYTEDRRARVESQMLHDIEIKARIVPDINNYETDLSNPSKHPDLPVTQLDSHVGEWVNHLADFMEADKTADRVSYPGIENIRVSVVTSEGVKEHCGEEAGACNGMDHIIMPDHWKIPGFLSILFHEIGHTNFHGSEEFPAKGNELVMGLKAYQFSRPIGTLILPSILGGAGDENNNEYSAFGRMYAQGAMYAVINMLNHNGNIEAAMNDVAHSQTLVIETEMQKKLAETPGATPAEQHYHLWNELLDNPGFFNELIGPTGHLGVYEAWELIDYLRILNHSANTWNMTNQEEVFAIRNELREDFVKNTNYTNPYMRARVLTDHLSFQHTVKREIRTEFGRDSLELFNHIEDILNSYSKYPCDSMNPYTCPAFVRNPKDLHILLYADLLNSVNAIDTPETDQVLTDRTIEFIEKFYPGTNVMAGNLEKLQESESVYTNNLVPILAWHSGYRAILNNQYDVAEKLLKAAVSVQCVEGGFYYSLSMCEDAQEASQNLLDYHFPQ